VTGTKYRDETTQYGQCPSIVAELDEESSSSITWVILLPLVVQISVTKPLLALERDKACEMLGASALIAMATAATQ
jgi:hypothetical protein